MDTMYRRGVCGIFLCCSALAAYPASAAGAKLAESNLSLMLGQKQLDDNDWGPVDAQVQWGVIADLGRKDSVVNLVVSFFSSADDSSRNGVEYSGETWELGLGIRKPFKVAPDIAPFIEVGAAVVDTSLEQRPAAAGDSSDSTFGVWAGGGVNFAVGERLTVGALLRYTSASATLLGQDRESGGIHFGVMAGLGF